MKRKIINLLLMLFAAHMVAQAPKANNRTKSELKVLVKPIETGVKLRWAPSTKEHWLYMKDKGIDIYRASFDKSLPSADDYKMIQENVNILPEAEFAFIVDDPQVNEYVKLVGAASYGEWETVKLGTASNDNWGQRVQELESRFLTVLYACDMSFNAAESVGMAYFDSEAKKGHNYSYKFVLRNDTIYSPLYKVISKSSQKDDPIVIIKAGKEKENQVVLNWPRSSNEKHFTAYHIERSKDGQSFTRLTDKPYINAETTDIKDLPYIVYTDSVTNYQPHYYRIIGIDPFGDESKPSEVVRLMGRDRTPPVAPVIDSAYLSEDQSVVKLNWDFETLSPDLEEIVIKKSPQFEGPYMPIDKIDKSKSMYEDKFPSLVYLQHYQVCAIDTAGNEACSYGKYAIVNDQIAPDAPTGFSGSIDSSGIVTLRWELGSEDDLFGYFVHKSNGKGRVFANMTNKAHRDIVWRDTITLHTLTEKVYYKVNAVDLRKNYSSFSEIIELSKPDTIPPNPSIFKDYKVAQDAIDLTYALSGSHDVQTVILRRVSDQDNMAKEITLALGTTTYEDTDIQANTKYKYDLITYDDAGLSTTCPQSLVLTTKDDKNFHAVNLKFVESEDDIILNWDPPKGEVDFVKIYKGKKEATTLSFKSIRTGNSATFSKKVLKDQFLKVKIFYKNGSKSAFSNVVRV